MADEPISGRGGSLILDCCYGTKQLVPRDKEGGYEYRHPSEGTLTSVDIDDGSGKTQTVKIQDSTKATIVMHYEVPP